MLRFAAREIREKMAELGIRRLSEVIGRREMLVRKADLTGKSALIDLGLILNAPHGRVERRNFEAQTREHMPKHDERELTSAQRALIGEDVELTGSLTNERRCVGVAAAGEIARKFGDLGLPKGSMYFIHSGAAGHFYAAYSVDGMSFRLTGVAADSCFTAAYGGSLTILPPKGHDGLALVGNAFGYGARGGSAYIAGKAGNRFGICLRKNHEGGGPQIVVEGVEANAFQYMTGGTALVLGRTGANLGSGMTGGRVYLLDADLAKLNSNYVHALPLDPEDVAVVRQMLQDHLSATQSKVAKRIVEKFDESRFVKVVTVLRPEIVSEAVGALAEILG
jgi:glutamate synthase domain-containing protein 3